MYKKHGYLVILSTLIFLVVISCDMGGSSIKNVSVSVESGSLDRSMGRYIIEPITDDSYYKADRQGEAKGTLVASFTPEEFIFDLDRLDLYSSDQSEGLASLRSTPEGVIIPRHVNITHADSFIRNFEITSNERDGIWIQFLPDIGSDIDTAAIYGRAAFNTLIWINPPDADFKEVVIVLKAGSEPVDENDGEEVYRGYEPNFCDESVETGTHYYYKICTVDYAGNLSSGVSLDVVSEE